MLQRFLLKQAILKREHKDVSLNPFRLITKSLKDFFLEKFQMKKQLSEEDESYHLGPGFMGQNVTTCLFVTMSYLVQEMN